MKSQKSLCLLSDLLLLVWLCSVHHPHLCTPSSSSSFLSPAAVPRWWSESLEVLFQDTKKGSHCAVYVPGFDFETSLFTTAEIISIIVHFKIYLRWNLSDYSSFFMFLQHILKTTYTWFVWCIVYNKNVHQHQIKVALWVGLTCRRRGCMSGN